MVHLAHCWGMKPLLCKNSVNWKKQNKTKPQQIDLLWSNKDPAVCDIQEAEFPTRFPEWGGGSRAVRSRKRLCWRLKGQGESQDQLSTSVSAEFHAHMSGALLWCQHKPCCVASLPCAILCLNYLQCVWLLCKRQQTLLFVIIIIL